MLARFVLDNAINRNRRESPAVFYLHHANERFFPQAVVQTSAMQQGERYN